MTYKPPPPQSLSSVPKIPEALRLQRLQVPTGRIRMVLDTDTYNEIDDQFALVHALLSPDKLEVEAIYAAPFFNERSDGPGHGMELSYDEILRLLERLGRSPENFVYRGSNDYLGPNSEPCDSEAVRDLIDRALGSPEDDPLYVVAIGAITNIASALLLEPRIANHIVVVWLGGHALNWPHTKEFNLYQDVPAARTVFDSEVPLVLVPCFGVTTHLTTTLTEIERYVEPFGEIGAFLASRFRETRDDHMGYSRVLWDMAPIAYLLNESWVSSELVQSPIVTDQVTWSVDRQRHLIRSASFVSRDPILRDFFQKLKSLSVP
ncbi:MAG: nucleoside hydrolase [Deinococcales bacterium]|nr:nucleoside hydrolase [Deinococcales bacterium]